jgi:predicted nuclease of predicted toxin-antitoxin system
MARMYSNENFPLPVVEHLRMLGHDMLSSRDAGNANKAIDDEDVLKFAIEQDRAVLTFNRKHFIRLHRQLPNHRGIIICTSDDDFVALAQRIHEAVSGLEELAGRLIKVYLPNLSKRDA